MSNPEKVLDLIVAAKELRANGAPDEVVAELETDGWLVNQTRMWLASHWTVRNNVAWLHGQERQRLG